ncbi:hypothetical protein RCIA42 [Methanocella arvoryzae MRE50]|uniref:Uncharacterized protein n=1 Tax=Methanocella arvoryzae (strain DSM 22066 / NBRC 105507 / MRE50) TaxID=351160 RepID=Q0W613_METAR|nr:hypothetical protein RCIA42 [Methanocella arvoryzae MRE50]
MLRSRRGGRRGSRSIERTFKLGGHGGHGDQREGYVRYPEVRENIFKKSSQTFPHSQSSSQTSPPSPTSQPENPPRPPGNSPTSRSFSSALLEKPVFMRRVLGPLASLAVFSTHTGPTSNFSQPLPEYSIFHKASASCKWYGHSYKTF